MVETAEQVAAADRGRIMAFRGILSSPRPRLLSFVVRRQKLESSMEPAEELWACLRRVRSLRFVARSASPNGWNGVGVGTVEVAAPGESVLTFTEAGRWHPEVGRETQFRNVFRWSLLGPESIRLEHLRFGPDHPVLLFDMAPSLGGMWSSVSPHLCREDCYSAELRSQAAGMLLQWAIAGPKKSESIEYIYSWADQDAEQGAAADVGCHHGFP